MNAPRDLVAHEVSVIVGGKRLLTQVSCVLAAGSMVGICGPNGAGKSTLLRVLAGLQPPHPGEVLLGGAPLPHLAGQERARQIGYLPQHAETEWPLTVRELVSLGRFPHAGETRATAALAVATALATLGLDPLAARPLETLSGGERTRAHLGRLIAGEHAFVLADEPTAALDPAAQFEVLGLLRARADAGAGVAVVLHDLPLAARFCDALILLSGGRCAAVGPPREVLNAATLEDVFNVAGNFDAVTGLFVGCSPLQ